MQIWLLIDVIKPLENVLNKEKQKREATFFWSLLLISG